ncbi:Carbon monoxide dehydrogenase medium chain [Pigmentiphaga humi]|uniref:Carbon monoxide dehydrogenase medium chain n=1 Tax=Pigmentiphaga humi TaxID=2478468 RepID=A0A3P4AZK8_9BURK|nr:FAD binding domain-containing protein [Pigmentiphaga humi]VCU68265.1 Carbon monoxide dehydrogenase medium chain [Pigmentiphaga humi]
MKPTPFLYARPASAHEAVTLLQRYADSARVLAGGQSLVPMMNFRIARPEVLVDLGGCGELAFIRRDGERLEIGAMTRQGVAERDDTVRAMCPLICLALGNAGPVPVRNRGTVGGMLANCYPAADLVCAALCLDAELDVLGPSGHRIVAAQEFFIAQFTTALEPDELLYGFAIACKPGRRYAYGKLSDHPAGAAAVAIALAAIPAGEAEPLAEVAACGLGFDSVAVRLPGLEHGLSSHPQPDLADIRAWLAEDMAQFGADPQDAATAYKLHAAAALVARSLPDLCRPPEGAGTSMVEH